MHRYKPFKKDYFALQAVQSIMPAAAARFRCELPELGFLRAFTEACEGTLMWQIYLVNPAEGGRGHEGG